MRIRLARASLALALVLIAPAALAQIQVIKTPPLAESESIPFGISAHIPFPPGCCNWAGAIVKAHLLDNQELDVTNIHFNLPARSPLGTFPASFNLPSPLGLPSANLQSSPISITFWHPSAQLSGISVQTSQFIPLATLALHAKNTTPANNSDTDATLMLWNIWHVIAAPLQSTLVPLLASDRIWVSSNVINVGQLHTAGSFFQFPVTGPTPFSPTAHWLHISDPVTFHLTQAGSAFYATFAGTLGLGVEHVPEPASGLLVGGGILALALGGRARHRRLRTA